ncbi:MAG: LysR family transcriptional regulator [Cytophagaceae bacterium]|jgi:LysR family hydrogen peroxide-inducible transcriptional activator|nr:LysR family transcriptional regulator [Cytophagaceae bacterium]
MLITLRQMQYVIAVADTGSFSKAADVCAADQSTVSQQVKLMEERLGVQLFDRNSLPVRVTPDGQALIEKAKDIITRVEDLIAPFKQPKKVQTV